MHVLDIYKIQMKCYKYSNYITNQISLVHFRLIFLPAVIYRYPLGPYLYSSTKYSGARDLIKTPVT